MRARSWAMRGLPLLAVPAWRPVFTRFTPNRHPLGIDAVTLTQPAYVFDTAEQHKVRVVVAVHGLRHPFRWHCCPPEMRSCPSAARACA